MFTYSVQSSQRESSQNIYFLIVNASNNSWSRQFLTKKKFPTVQDDKVFLAGKPEVGRVVVIHFRPRFSVQKQNKKYRDEDDSIPLKINLVFFPSYLDSIYLIERRLERRLKGCWQLLVEVI